MHGKAVDPGQSKSGQFQKVGECLYRYSSNGAYYALVKQGGKQIRRSLRTTDRKLADRRLADFRTKVERVSSVRRTDGKRRKSSLTFSEIGAEWFETARATLKPSSARRREGMIANPDGTWLRARLVCIAVGKSSKNAGEKSAKNPASGDDLVRKKQIHF